MERNIIMKTDKSKWYCKDVFSDNPYDYNSLRNVFSHGIHIHDFFELNIVLSECDSSFQCQ